MNIKILSLLAFILILPVTLSAQDLFDKEKISFRRQWDLSDTESNATGLFKIKQYKPVYLLIGNYTNNINQRPKSANPTNTVSDDIALTPVECKFQLSLKTKVFDEILGDKLGGDIWVGYTQTSRWQVYNTELSRPFRESNYEPEIMYIMPISCKHNNREGVFAGIGLNHQSNGQSDPLSRSWNRVIAQIAWETEHLSIILKPWWRIQESAEVDNNPNIENYIGRVEILAAYGKGRHDISIIGRHSGRLRRSNRGSLQIDYSLQVWDNLKFHTQLFHGYGESLIDYNHKQTTIGFGLSLTQWR